LTNRERFVTALNGGLPDKIPYVLYGRTFNYECPAEWDEFVKRGLIQMPRVRGVKEIREGVEESVIKYIDERTGRNIERRAINSPAGELFMTYHDGWPQDYYVKTPDDCRAMEYFLRNTKLELDKKIFCEQENEIGDTGVTVIRAERSPLQKMIVDYAGLAGYSYLCADAPAAVEGLIEAYADYAAKYFSLLASHPCAFIQIPENLTSEQCGPERFKKYHMPFYEKIIPALHGAGKRVFAHYDGKLKILAALIAETGLDAVESFTPPPEGDVSYADFKKAAPDKTIMAHLGLCDYLLPPETLRERVIFLARQASADGRKILFEISEDCPPNWRVSVPVIMDALETKIF